jgi:alpha-tubulin suppressor-like RCC1 family protein
MKRLSPILITALAIALVLLNTSDNAQRVAAYAYTAVAPGGQHTCALTGAGAVKCWGANDEGQAGDGTTTMHPLPVAVSGLGSGATAIAAGGRHSCAVISGGVKCWGYNVHGQIGDGTAGTDRLTPTTVCASGSAGSCVALSSVVSIDAGDAFTCVTTSSSAVKCWGRNWSSELGNGTQVDSYNPVQVSGLTSGVNMVTTGDQFACALTSAGGVKCWGVNTYGQLGDGTTVRKSTPVDVSGLTSGVTWVSAGDTHACALLTGGTVKCWGYNAAGELGNDTNTNSSTPVVVCAAGAHGSPCEPLSGVSRVMAGGGHTCAYTFGLTMVCWGWDGFGQIGDGTAISITNFMYRPTTVLGFNQPIYQFALGAAHSCVVLDPSGAWDCWGWNIAGQLGDGTTADRATWAGDFDRDGCIDSKELQTATGSETTGGRRDLTKFWDFFDTPDTTNTTLSAAITSSATPPFTVTVALTSAFPAANDTFFIDNEQFSWDTKTSTTFHVTARALTNTAAAQHNSGAFVVRNVRDKTVNSSDASRVTARFFTNGSTSIDPLSAPPPTGYHTAFDRTSGSPYSWSTGAPDGMIRTADILAATNQSGHSCQ